MFGKGGEIILRGRKERMEHRASTVEEQPGSTYCRRLYEQGAAGASGDSVCLFSWACGSTHSLSSSSSSSSVMVQAQAGKTLKGHIWKYKYKRRVLTRRDAKVYPPVFLLNGNHDSTQSSPYQ